MPWKGIGAATEKRENCLPVLFNPAGCAYQFNYYDLCVQNQIFFTNLSFAWSYAHLTWPVCNTTYVNWYIDYLFIIGDGH